MGKGSGGSRKKSSGGGGFVEKTDTEMIADSADATDAEKTALGMYQVDSDINYALRNDNALDNESVSVVNQIDNLTVKNKLKSDTLLHRTEFYDDVPDRFSVGSTYIDKGYTSTSVSGGDFIGNDWKELGDHRVRVTIKAPKGTKGVYVNAVRRTKAYESENEYLLGRGTKYRVISRKTKGDTTDVTVEIVP